MAKKDLGTKRVCPECEAKFYDLAKNPATCPMCKNSFDPAELDIKPIIHTGPLKPQKSTMDDEDDAEEVKAEELDEEDIDESEAEAKELELDGDDVAVIGGSKDDDDAPEFDGFSTDEDEDQDAALVDDDDNELPPPDDGSDDDDVEEVEI